MGQEKKGGKELNLHNTCRSSGRLARRQAAGGPLVCTYLSIRVRQMVHGHLEKHEAKGNSRQGLSGGAC